MRCENHLCVVCDNMEETEATCLNKDVSSNMDTCDETNVVENVGSSKRESGGGFTCCVPLCYNNSHKHKDIKFYVIPADKKLREVWLNNISRKCFKPTSGHRVCSAHFVGGKKTYLNNVPTITPKIMEKTQVKERTSRNSQGVINTSNDGMVFSDESPEEIELSLEDKLREEIRRLNEKISIMQEEDEVNTNKLKIEIDTLKTEIEMVRNELHNNKFTIDRFKVNNEMFKFYTGFPNYQLFTALLNYLKPAADHLNYWGNTIQGNDAVMKRVEKRRSPRTLSVEEELFLVLVRLRGNYPLEDLAVRYNMSTSNISRILITWYDFLHTQFRQIPIWGTRETINKTMPKCFKMLYPNTRVILDCSEIFIEVPSSFRNQSATFSSYKHHNTMKALVGIAPSGAVTFVSDIYVGRSSDKQIVKDCGILGILEPGDDVMADRGFDIENLMPEGVTLNIPPFMGDRPQLSLEDEIKTRKIASGRIHVERLIRRIKTYRILQSTLPINMSAEFNKIWVICCYLTNFLPPLIVEDETS